MLVGSENYQDRTVTNKLTNVGRGGGVDKCYEKGKTKFNSKPTTLSNVKYLYNISQRVLNDYRGPEILPTPL
jgi:hypothetical protein